MYALVSHIFCCQPVGQFISRNQLYKGLVGKRKIRIKDQLCCSLDVKGGYE